MSTPMLRRLQRLEELVNQVVNPEGPKEMILLAVPADDATAEAKTEFEARCSAAAVRGATVIGLVGVRPGSVIRRPVFGGIHEAPNVAKNQP
jgi:hypothetical protein